MSHSEPRVAMKSTARSMSTACDQPRRQSGVFPTRDTWRYRNSLPDLLNASLPI